MCGPAAPRYKGETLRTHARSHEGDDTAVRGTADEILRGKQKQKPPHAGRVSPPCRCTGQRARSSIFSPMVAPADATLLDRTPLSCILPPPPRRRLPTSRYIRAYVHPCIPRYAVADVIIQSGKRRCLDRCAVEIDRYDKCSTGAITPSLYRLAEIIARIPVEPCRTDRLGRKLAGQAAG